MNSQAAIELLHTETDRLGMRLSDETFKLLQAYLEYLNDYNSKVNLVSDADPLVVARRHVLDCLALVEVISQDDPDGRVQQKLVDIGSGAGLPGLIIAMACHDLEVVLLDSIGKKTKFLEETVNRLGLGQRVSVVTGRAEEWGRTANRAAYDYATSRAVGPLGMVAELCVPLLKVGGHLLCQKSRNQVDAEIAALGGVLSQLGAAKPELIVPKIQVADNEHVIVSIQKQKPTQDKFPRSWAEIIRQWR